MGGTEPKSVAYGSKAENNLQAQVFWAGGFCRFPDSQNGEARSPLRAECCELQATAFACDAGGMKFDMQAEERRMKRCCRDSHNLRDTQDTVGLTPCLKPRFIEMVCIAPEYIDPQDVGNS